MFRKVCIALLGITLLVSCEEVLEVQDISNAQVVLLAPSEGSMLMDSMVNFNWEGVEAAEVYSLQIATPNFESPSQFVVDTLLVIDSTFVGTRYTKILENNSYEWRIQAANSDFSTSYTTRAFSVNTGN